MPILAIVRLGVVDSAFVFVVKEYTIAGYWITLQDDQTVGRSFLVMIGYGFLFFFRQFDSNDLSQPATHSPTVWKCIYTGTVELEPAVHSIEYDVNRAAGYSLELPNRFLHRTGNFPAYTVSNSKARS